MLVFIGSFDFVCFMEQATFSVIYYSMFIVFKKTQAIFSQLVYSVI